MICFKQQTWCDCTAFQHKSLFKYEAFIFSKGFVFKLFCSEFFQMMDSMVYAVCIKFYESREQKANVGFSRPGANVCELQPDHQLDWKPQIEIVTCFSPEKSVFSFLKVKNVLLVFQWYISKIQYHPSTNVKKYQFVHKNITLFHYKGNYNLPTWRSRINQKIGNRFHLTSCILSREICQQLLAAEMLKVKQRAEKACKFKTKMNKSKHQLPQVQTGQSSVFK